MTLKNAVVATSATVLMVAAMVVLHACNADIAESRSSSRYPSESVESTGRVPNSRPLDYSQGAGTIDLHQLPSPVPPGSAPGDGRFRGARTVQAPATGYNVYALPRSASASSANPASGNATVLTDVDGLFARDSERIVKRSKADIITRIHPGEEVWIIVEADDARALTPNDDAPGCGAMVTTIPGCNGFVPVPLEHTDVTGNVSGYIASVDVKQTFHNPYDTKIEAVYVFPLPENAAVRDFLMTIGQRTIRGVIREREEANRIYEAAKAQGHVASIMNQERPNIFTQKVANIEPGKRIDVAITYFNTLAYSDGWFEFVFPMVVGPRFNPPSVGNQGIGASPRDAAGASGQRVDVAYLRPSDRSGHDISVDLRIDAGMAIEEVACKSHRVDVTREGENVRRIRLAKSDTVPNKDLVVRYRVAGDTVKSAMFTRISDDGAGYFSMLLVPPQLPKHLEREAVEFVFVIDTSGSMNGEPLRLAKEAVREGLDRMRAGDTFQIIDFSDSVSQLGNRPVPATRENLKRGRAYLDSMGAGGGTMMLNGIRAALDFPLDDGRMRFVVFLTDGFIGNESQILSEIDARIGDSRIFSFGIGSSVNRFLMDEMGKAGRGAVAYIGVRDRAREVMAMFFDRVSHPAMMNVRVDLGSVAGAEMYPPRVPDLFCGRPVVISGRYDAAAAGTSAAQVRISGTAGGRKITIAVAPESEGADRTGALEAIWARAKIASLTNAALRGDPHGEYTGAIRQTALAHGLMSAYTSFIAVDSMAITEGTRGVTVPVGVPVPQGVEYSTTVGTNGRDR